MRPLVIFVLSLIWPIAAVADFSQSDIAGTWTFIGTYNIHENDGEVDDAGTFFCRTNVDENGNVLASGSYCLSRHTKTFDRKPEASYEIKTNIAGGKLWVNSKGDVDGRFAFCGGLVRPLPRTEYEPDYFDECDFSYIDYMRLSSDKQIVTGTMRLEDSLSRYPYYIEDPVMQFTGYKH